MDDQIPSPFATPERDNPSTLTDERSDGVDSDLDGVPDDVVFSLPAMPFSNLVPAPPLSCPPLSAFIDLVFDRQLKQGFALDSANKIWRIREGDNGDLAWGSITPLSCTLDLGINPTRGIGVDGGNGNIFVTQAIGANNLILRRFSTKGDTISELEGLTLTNLDSGLTSDGRLVIDSKEHLIFIIGNGQLTIVSHRGEYLAQLLGVLVPGAREIALSLIFPTSLFISK